METKSNTWILREGKYNQTIASLELCLLFLLLTLNSPQISGNPCFNSHFKWRNLSINIGSWCGFLYLFTDVLHQGIVLLNVRTHSEQGVSRCTGGPVIAFTSSYMAKGGQGLRVPVPRQGALYSEPREMPKLCLCLELNSLRAQRSNFKQQDLCRSRDEVNQNHELFLTQVWNSQPYPRPPSLLYFHNWL